MDMHSVTPNSRVITGLGEASGAIGLVCGLLLVCMFLFFRHLMENVKMRDAEVVAMNRQLQDALVANAAALAALNQLLQQRPCLINTNEALDHVYKESKTAIYLKKRDDK